eukprot:15185708-Ditylum_brightwellii.AAC.1
MNMVGGVKRDSGKAIAKEKMKKKETMNMVAEEKRKVDMEKRKVSEVKRKASEALTKEKKKRKDTSVEKKMKAAATRKIWGFEV